MDRKTSKKRGCFLGDTNSTSVDMVGILGKKYTACLIIDR